MALWRIKRCEVNPAPANPGMTEFAIVMQDTDANVEEAVTINVNTATYKADPASLLAALVAAGYTPNDWGGV